MHTISSEFLYLRHTAQYIIMIKYKSLKLILIIQSTKLNWLLMVILFTRVIILKMENVVELGYMSKNLFQLGSRKILCPFQTVLCAKCKSNEKSTSLLFATEAQVRAKQDLKFYR